MSTGRFAWGGGGIDDLHLRADGEVLKIAGVEGGGFEGDAGLGEFFGEETGFGGLRAGGEAVQVDDAH